MSIVNFKKNKKQARGTSHGLALLLQFSHDAIVQTFIHHLYCRHEFIHDRTDIGLRFSVYEPCELAITVIVDGAICQRIPGE